MLKEENVFINLKCSFPYDFYVLSIDTLLCHPWKNKITDKNQKFNAKRVISPFNTQPAIRQKQAVQGDRITEP